MRGAILLMIGIGVAIGLAVPMKKQVAPAAEPVAHKAADAPRQTSLLRASNGHFYTDAFVNGKTVHFIVDTGSTDVALTLNDARMIGLNVDPTRFRVVGTGASGAVMGQEVNLGEVNLDGKRVRDIQGVVLQGLEVSLLGETYLRQLKGVEINADTMTLR